MIDNYDDELIEFSLPPEHIQLAAPAPMSFAPWHRPRKQYVRIKQWLHHVRGTIQSIGIENFNDGEPLRYLTLPGPDLLDIRMIADYCTEASVRMKYTGFCYTDETEDKRLRQNINEFSLTHKDSVVQSSTIIRARLEDVGIKNSEAQMALYRGGPFHVINIDACEPLATGTNQSGRLVDAIRSITQYQLSQRRQRWLLFLTTPIQCNTISNESMEALHGQISLNAQNDADFSHKLKEMASENEAVDDYLKRCCEKNGNDLISVFSLGVAKWLIHLAEQANFKVIILKSFSYSMFKKEPYDPNMVSLCFLFEPTPISIQDNTGLTINSTNSQNQSNNTTHIRAITYAYDILNLDNHLAENNDVCNAMIEETKNLLRNVGYPVDDPDVGYDAWLQSENNQTTSATKVA